MRARARSRAHTHTDTHTLTHTHTHAIALVRAAQALLATLLRHYDLELVSDPAYIKWLHCPVAVPDKRWPLWARLRPAARPIGA